MTVVLTWTVILLNVGYALLLGARMVAGSPATSARPGPPAPTATRHVRSANAPAALALVLAVAAVYYAALIAWLAGVRLPGGALMETTRVTYVIGLLLSLSGLVLMGWTYAIFQSWRWRAEISPGHQLITRGPFRLVRHPIYLSFALFYLGACFLLPFTVFLLHALASFLAYDYRARAEEGVLLDAFGDDYRTYRARTSRFIPRLY